MKRNYEVPQCQIVQLDIESIMITNSNGQTGGTIPGMGWGDNSGNTGGTIPGMGWGDNSGNTGGTIPGMGWGASERRNNEWNDYENN